MLHKVFRSYSYVIFGPEKVGKTNIITRFTKDQFTQTHNLTLQGQQNASLTLDGRIFQVNLYDTAGQQNMMSLKAVWRNNKDGFIFPFAINNEESYQSVINQIREIKQKSLYPNVAMILVGNKLDLQTQRRVSKKTAILDANILGIKYFEVSAKASSKDEIDSLICELIEMNEMERFNVIEQNKNGLTQWLPCQRWPCLLM